MKTLTECRNDGERLMLLLDFEPTLTWFDLLVRGVIYLALLAIGGTVVMSVVVAAFG